MMHKTLLAAGVASLLALGASETMAPHHKIFEVELENGDQMAVQIDSAPIRLSKGGQDYAIEPEAIIALDNDRGITGVIEGSPLRKHIDRSFVKDPDLTVYLTGSGKSVKIAWDEIRHIRWIDHLDASVQLHSQNEPSRLPEGEEAGIAIRYVPAKSTDRVFADAETLPNFKDVNFQSDREFSDKETFQNDSIALEEVKSESAKDELIAENKEPVPQVGEDIPAKAFEQKEGEGPQHTTDVEFVSERETPSKHME